MEIKDAENKILINGLEVNYTDLGEGDTIIILPGWGMSSFYWFSISQKLAKAGFRVIAFDLPGFGKSSTPAEVWGNNEYVDFVMAFLKKKNIERFSLIGHSFGGSLAIKIGACYKEKIMKIVFCDAAFVRRQRLNFRQKTSKLLAGLIPQSFKKLPGLQFFEKIVYKIAGVSDYYRASPMLREIFKKVVSEDTSYLAPKISAPCLIVWGEKDLATPLEDGILLNSLVSNSYMKIIPEVGHNPYRKKENEFFEAVEKFLKN
ncbi:MAG: alpha/beta hydrolase [Candidatus Paceibacterota bacterium]